ncbi:MAG: acetate--CoA ligase family protein [Candidatus Dojkabacteria bacterium]|nr:MAG: acetate--CoA ligase family protein [Candidatus Dojkabacteria bacterium]
MTTSLERLFNPSKVAVVGVSADPTKLGTVVYDNIEKSGFDGDLYPVNPKYREIYGKKCFSKVSKIPGKVDLVIIVVPSIFVFDVIKDCARKKVPYAVIISAGFSETGFEGRKLEEQIAAFAREHGVRIIGPNCLGVTFTDSKLNASFAVQAPMPGNVAFMSQSGAFNTALLDLADNRKLGFKYFVSLGNKVDINELDLLTEWLQDDSIKVIGAYIEQFSDGRRFLDIIANNKKKPIVLLHSGESEAGKRAVASHTGSLAGSANVIRAALRQYGVIQVDSEEKMLSALMMFSRSEIPDSNKVAVITNAGGPGIILTDHLEKNGLELAKLTAETSSIIKKSLPPAASIHNPIDVLGDAMSDRYKAVLDTLDKDKNVDAIIILLTPQLTTQIEDTAKLIINYDRRTETPIIPVFIGEKYVMQGLDRLWSNQIAAYQYIEEAVFSLKQMVAYKEFTEKQGRRSTISTTPGRSSRQVRSFASENEEVLKEEITKDICKEVRMDLPREALVSTLEQALDFRKKAGTPIVLKAVSEDVVHKIDEKYIYLNLDSEKDVEKAFKTLYKKVSSLVSPAKPRLLAQEMIMGGVELIVGVDREGSTTTSGFGHTLLIGTGGIYTELYKDTALRVLNITKDDASEMLAETKVHKILTGYRGQKKLAVDKVEELIMKVQRMVNFYPDISSLDINPLIVTEDRAVAVDVKLFVKKR